MTLTLLTASDFRNYLVSFARNILLLHLLERLSIWMESHFFCLNPTIKISIPLSKFQSHYQHFNCTLCEPISLFLVYHYHPTITLLVYTPYCCSWYALPSFFLTPLCPCGPLESMSEVNGANLAGQEIYLAHPLVRSLTWESRVYILS